MSLRSSVRLNKNASHDHSFSEKEELKTRKDKKVSRRKNNKEQERDNQREVKRSPETKKDKSLSESTVLPNIPKDDDFLRKFNKCVKAEGWSNKETKIFFAKDYVNWKKNSQAEIDFAANRRYVVVPLSKENYTKWALIIAEDFFTDAPILYFLDPDTGKQNFTQNDKKVVYHYLTELKKAFASQQKQKKSKFFSMFFLFL
jgi:hypothetical protein